MARFHGTKQGVAVWARAVLVAVVVAVVGAVARSRYNVLDQLNSFLRIAVSQGQLSTAGLIAVLAVAMASLGGAIMGGRAGMRFHCKVDQLQPPTPT